MAHPPIGTPVHDRLLGVHPDIAREESPEGEDRPLPHEDPSRHQDEARDEDGPFPRGGACGVPAAKAKPAEDASDDADNDNDLTPSVRSGPARVEPAPDPHYRFAKSEQT